MGEMGHIHGTKKRYKDIAHGTYKIYIGQRLGRYIERVMDPRHGTKTSELDTKSNIGNKYLEQIHGTKT